MFCFQNEKEQIFITYLTCQCLIYRIYIVLRDDKDSEEQRFIREKKFIVGERAIKDLISKIRCEKCGEDIIPSSITEGEKISSGVKYTYLCNVSCFRPLSSTRNTLQNYACRFEKQTVNCVIKQWKLALFLIQRNIYNIFCLKQNNHLGKWISTSFYGGRSVINMLLQLMILLSGKLAMGL